MTDTDKITIPLKWLETTIEAAAQAAADLAIEKHTLACPIVAVTDRVRKLEIRSAAMLAFMLGSGVLGGGASAIVTYLLRSGGG